MQAQLLQAVRDRAMAPGSGLRATELLHALLALLGIGRLPSHDLELRARAEQVLSAASSEELSSSLEGLLQLNLMPVVHTDKKFQGHWLMQLLAKLQVKVPRP